MTSTSPLTLSRTLAFGCLAGLTYAAVETARLNLRYPLHYGSSAPPASHALWPAGLGPAVEVRARTRIPRGVDPRETLISAFYSTWTLRVEGFVCRHFGVGSAIDLPPVPVTTFKAAPKPLPHEASPAPYTPPPTPAGTGTQTPTPETLPTAYASGLFPVIGRSAESTMVFWGSINDMGGAQLLTCTRVPNTDREVQISFACAETPFLKEGTVIGWIGTKFHRMYMRFLLDRAAQRMDRWAQAAEAR